jgi:hypothetical protein
MARRPPPDEALTNVNTVRETFDELRQALTHVVTPLLDLDNVGHYAVALLVAIGSEALSRLQGKSQDIVFVGLLTKHGLEPELASEVFDALRNGIAHTYNTKFIKKGSFTVELIVSWREKPHLSSRRDPPGLFLNVRTMWADLRQVIDALDAALPPGGNLPAEWVEESNTFGDPRTARAWRHWITTHEAGA